jgi:hypothetical protein
MARLAVILGISSGYVAVVAGVCLVFVGIALVLRRLIYGEWFV